MLSAKKVRSRNPRRGSGCAMDTHPPPEGATLKGMLRSGKKMHSPGAPGTGGSGTSFIQGAPDEKNRTRGFTQ